MGKKIAFIKKKAPEYEVNPFVRALAEPGVMMVRPKQDSVIAKAEGIIDLDTGEIQRDILLMGRRKFVDKADFTKVYARNIGFIFDLSRSYQKVFRYILENIMYADNMVILNPSKVCEVEGIVRATYERAINALLHHKVIAKSINVHMYFVNPVFICKGERFAMYTEYVQKAAQLSMFEDLEPPKESEHSLRQL